MVCTQMSVEQSALSAPASAMTSFAHGSRKSAAATNGKGMARSSSRESFPTQKSGSSMSPSVPGTPVVSTLAESGHLLEIGALIVSLIADCSEFPNLCLRRIICLLEGFKQHLTLCPGTAAVSVIIVKICKQARIS